MVDLPLVGGVSNESQPSVLSPAGLDGVQQPLASGVRSAPWMAYSLEPPVAWPPFLP